MNREDVAMDLTFENLDILRKEVHAAKLLLSECDKVLEEDGGVYIELRAFLSGKMDADEVVELLASQQGEQAEDKDIRECETCKGTGEIDNRLGGWRTDGISKCDDCDGHGEWIRNHKHPEQADGAQGELWAVHAQGPDDLYAAFSREDAEKHAAELNDLPMPEGISVGAVVIPSPWSAAEHWHYLAEQEREHKDAIEGQRRNLAATLLSQNHELMEARAALAQPSPAQVYVCPECGTGMQIDPSAKPSKAQPSPAPELERPEVYDSNLIALCHADKNPRKFVSLEQHDRIVGALRAESDKHLAEKLEWVRRASRPCCAEEHAAQARVAGLVAALERAATAMWNSEANMDNAAADAEEAIGNAKSDAQVAQAGQVPDRLPRLTEVEKNDLYEFYLSICCDAGHRVEKDGMRRLAAIGAVESVGFGKHRLTEFGTYLLTAAPAQGGE